MNYNQNDNPYNYNQQPNYNQGYNGYNNGPQYQNQYNNQNQYPNQNYQPQYNPYNNQYQNQQESFLTYENNQDMFDMSKLNVRMNFIKKLIVTAGFSGAVMHSYDLQIFMKEQAWIFIVALVVNIVCSYALFCYQSCSRTVPRNFILLGLFTITEAYFVGAICAMSNPTNVFIALALTAALVVGLSLFAFTTKQDFTMMGGTLFMLFAILICASLLSIFFRSKILEIAISGFTIFVFGFYLIYDTQLIVGDKDRGLSVDDYIIGALSLYIDIIRIFLEILKILNELNRD